MLVFLFSQARDATGNDWTRFLGPAGRASVETVDVPLEWNESSNIHWKASLPGPGSSSPIVLGNRIFLTCYTGYGVNPAEDIKTSDKQAGDLKDLSLMAEEKYRQKKADEAAMKKKGTKPPPF